MAGDAMTARAGDKPLTHSFAPRYKLVRRQRITLDQCTHCGQPRSAHTAPERGQQAEPPVWHGGPLRCPSCGSGHVDYRDEETVQCGACGWKTDAYEAMKAAEPKFYEAPPADSTEFPECEEEGEPPAQLQGGGLK